MQPNYTRPQEKNSINQDMNPAKEKRLLLEEIRKKKQESEYLADKIQKKKAEHKKILQTLKRRTQRLIKYRQKQEELWKHKNSPEYFLHATGLMNQFMNEYIFSHQQEQGMQMEHNQINPDLMTYQQLLQLGDSIGKVSRGISEQQFMKLKRVINLKKNESCSICITKFEMEEKIVELPCRHEYHEECIGQWLREFNSCPMCKKYVLEE